MIRAEYPITLIKFMAELNPVFFDELAEAFNRPVMRIQQLLRKTG